jgi:hypothetical protein
MLENWPGPLVRGLESVARRSRIKISTAEGRRLRVRVQEHIARQQHSGQQCTRGPPSRTPLGAAGYESESHDEPDEADRCQAGHGPGSLRPARADIGLEGPNVLAGGDEGWLAERGDRDDRGEQQDKGHQSGRSGDPCQPGHESVVFKVMVDIFRPLLSRVESPLDGSDLSVLRGGGSVILAGCLLVRRSGTGCRSLRT